MKKSMEVQFRSLPLKEMDSSLLSLALLAEAERLGFRHAVEFAVGHAALFHRGQLRWNRGNLPRTPYIEHPLRVALRLIRWGETDSGRILGAIFHDVPEDQAERVAELTGRHEEGMRLDDDNLRRAFFRDEAFQWIERHQPEAEDIVVRCTNTSGGYRKHVIENVLPDPGATLVKASDFVDNAGSLHWTIDSVSLKKTLQLAKKYREVSDDLRSALVFHHAEGAYTDEVFRNVIAAVDSTILRLDEILRSAGDS